jgi:hypothetical protein
MINDIINEVQNTYHYTIAHDEESLVLLAVSILVAVVFIGIKISLSAIFIKTVPNGGGGNANVSSTDKDDKQLSDQQLALVALSLRNK